MKLTLHLHKKQGIVYRDPARFKVLVAGRRFGKTILAILTLLIDALCNPNRLLWYVGPTYKQAKMIAWKMLKAIVPKKDVVKMNESELSVGFKNGSEICLKGADNEDSLRGAGLDGLVVDEFASIYNNWSVWYEVLRPALTDKKGWALFIGTPKGKDSFFELYMKGQRKEDGFRSWQFKTVDNPYIDKAEVEEARKAVPARYFRQEYEASFEDFVGLIYPEFTANKHVLDPFPIPDWWEKIGAIDPAISGTTAALKVAIDEDGKVIIYDEYYEKDKRVSEVCQQIKDKNTSWFIDPAASAKNIVKDGKLYSLYNEYLDNGINARPGENDVTAGINRVAEYFKTDQIRIFKTCTQFIWEIERYHWAERPESTLGAPDAKPFKKDDHLCMIGNSKVNTVNGDIPIKDLVGKTGHVYSYNGGRICAKPFTECRKTGIQKEVWKVTYTDGGSLIGTPDHPVMLRDGAYRAIKDLKPQDSLMPLYKRIDNHGHEIIVLNNNKKIFAHRLVYQDVIGDCTGKQVHHENELKYDNRPNNLVALTRAAHCGIHAKGRKRTSSAREKQRITLRRKEYSKEAKERQRQHLKDINHLAKAWHRSSEGVEWHKQHGVNCAKKNFVNKVKMECRVCGKSFMAWENIKHRSLYCHPNCKAKATRQRRKALYNHKVAKVEFYGYEDVYNMAVEGTHNFACDGVIVHNCDSLRYLIMSRPVASMADTMRRAEPGSVAELMHQMNKPDNWRDKF